MPYLFSLKPNVMSCYNLQVGHTTLLRAWTFSKKIANLELNNLTWICSNFAGNNSRPLRIRKKVHVLWIQSDIYTSNHKKVRNKKMLDEIFGKERMDESNGRILQCNSFTETTVVRKNINHF